MQLLLGGDSPTLCDDTRLVDDLCTMLRAVSHDDDACESAEDYIWQVVSLFAMSPAFPLPKLARAKLAAEAAPYSHPNAKHCLALVQQAVTARDLECALHALRVLATCNDAQVIMRTALRAARPPTRHRGVCVSRNVRRRV